MQNPAELAALLQHVGYPEVVVEIGCDVGGTLYAWRQICDRVYGITFPDNTLESGGQGVGYQLDTHGAEVFLGDSHSPEAVEWLSQRVTEVDLLFIDGDHSYDGVRQDFETFEPFVRPGGLVVFHDIAGDRPRIDVPRFWATLDGEEIVDPRRPIGFGIWTKEQ